MKIFLQVLLIFLVLSCDQEAPCPTLKNLGLLPLTDKSKSFIPEKYHSKTDTIVFTSSINEEKMFYYKSSLKLDGGVSANVNCESDPLQTTVVSFKYDYISYRFVSKDSFQLDFFVKIRGAEKGDGYYDLLNIWFQDKKEQELSRSLYGQINIITDLRTVSNEDNIYNPVSYTFYPSKIINGKLFQNVYGDGNPQWRISDVYWSQYKGLVGFKSIDGIEWSLKE